MELKNLSFRQLDPAEQDAYARILPRLMEEQAAIPAPLFDPMQINRILKAILMDHPELFWFEGKWFYESDPCGQDCILPQYTLPIAEQSRFRARLDAVFSELFPRGIAADPLTRIRRIYDWFPEHVAYDLQAPRSQTAYGALVDRRAVCKGISKAFQLLAEIAEIPAICVDGTIDGTGRHYWNIVAIGDLYCHVDVTMAFDCFRDFRRRVGDGGKYAYLCASDETIQSTHRWNVDALPLVCTCDVSKATGGLK